MGVLVCMSNGVSVRDSTCAQGSVISIQPPMVALLGQEMEGRWPWSFVDVLCRAISQHSVELSRGHCQAVRSKAAWAADHWGSRCCVDMVNGVLLHLAVDPPRKFCQEVVRRCSAGNDCHTGD
jgi:hypothetical protein